MKTSRQLVQLAAVLQDAWHYFDTAITGHGQFGSAKNMTLFGRLELYREGRERLIEALDILGSSANSHMRAVAEDLPMQDHIVTNADLKDLSKKGRSAAEFLGEEFGIDAYAGEAL